MNGKIDQAVTKVKRKAQAVVMAEVAVRIAQQPIVVRASGELSFTRAADADPAAANLLLFDPQLGAYRAVLTPPGTSWELVEKKQGTSIWIPGGST